jgi:hypothetical protein
MAVDDSKEDFDSEDDKALVAAARSCRKDGYSSECAIAMRIRYCDAMRIRTQTECSTLQIECGTARPDPFGVFGAREWVSPAPALPGLLLTCFKHY